MHLKCNSCFLQAYNVHIYSCLCWLIEMYCNCALWVHLLNHCSIELHSALWLLFYEMEEHFPYLCQSFYSPFRLCFFSPAHHRDHMVGRCQESTHLPLTHLQIQTTPTYRGKCQSALQLRSYSFPPDYVFFGGYDYSETAHRASSFQNTS